MTAVSKYVVCLSSDDRAFFLRVLSSGRHPARLLNRARILLKADSSEGRSQWDDQRIADALDCGVRTVARVRKQYVEGGLAAVTESRRPPGRHPKLNADQRRNLLSLLRTPPPGGGRWTMKALAESLVKQKIVSSIDPATVWRTLQQLQSAGELATPLSTVG